MRRGRVHITWILVCMTLLLFGSLLVATTGNMKEDATGDAMIDVMERHGDYGNERRLANDGPKSSTIATGYILDNSEPHEQIDDWSPHQSLRTTTVYGYWSYLDATGAYQPVKYAPVEIWGEGISGDVLLASTYTDQMGYFSANMDIDDGDGEAQGIYIYVKSETKACMVTTLGNSIYVTSTPAIHDIPDGSWYAGSWAIADNQRGAFHIMDVIIDGYQFIDAYDTPPPQVHAKWEDDYNTGGSYYGDSVMTIDGAPSDPDEWDVSVIAHEYGHFIYDEYTTYSVPVGSHCWNGRSTPELAWSEGWANFFQSAIKYHWGYPNPELHEETSWSGNLEAIWYSPSTGPWDDSESAIAGILLDIYDSSDDDQNGDGIGDSINELFAEIWDVVSNYNTGNAYFTIHDFWDGWFAHGHGYSQEMWQNYYEHGIEKELMPPSNATSYKSDHPENIRASYDAIDITLSGTFVSLSGIWCASILGVIALLIPTLNDAGRYLLPFR